MANNKSNSKQQRQTHTPKPSYRKGGRTRNKKEEFDKDSLDSKINSTSNSPDWYSSSAQLLKDSASFPYATALGSPVDAGIDTLTNNYIPGIYSIELLPTVGVSQSNSSPINIAARNIYSFVRHANSGHANYDSPDLMLYLVAMDNIYSMYTFMVRMYGVASAYTYYNRYYPKGLIESMYMDYNDVIHNLSNLRYFINSFAVKIASMAVPANMSYMQRHQWIYSGYYIDSESVKAQTYIYNPYGFHVYDELSGAGSLKMTQWKPSGNSLHTVRELIDYANAMIARIVESEDMNIMSGDILKAYGSDGIFKVVQVPDSYIIAPAYNPEVISQIQNAKILHNWHMPSFDITQDPISGAILCEPYLVTGGTKTSPQELTAVQSNTLVSMYKDNVEPGDTMVATRLSIVLNKNCFYNDTGKELLNLKSCGSEVVVNTRFCSGGSQSWAADKSFEWSSGPTISTIIPYESDNTYSIIQKLGAISAFNNHPCFYVGTQPAPNVKIVYSRFFDVNNYTIIDDNGLSKMHEVALLSEFSSPQVALMR